MAVKNGKKSCWRTASKADRKIKGSVNGAAAYQRVKRRKETKRNLGSNSSSHVRYMWRGSLHMWNTGAPLYMWVTGGPLVHLHLTGNWLHQHHSPFPVHWWCTVSKAGRTSSRPRYIWPCYMDQMHPISKLCLFPNFFWALYNFLNII